MYFPFSLPLNIIQSTNASLGLWIEADMFQVMLISLKRKHRKNGMSLSYILEMKYSCQLNSASVVPQCM